MITPSKTVNNSCSNFPDCLANFQLFFQIRIQIPRVLGDLCQELGRDQYIYFFLIHTQSHKNFQLFSSNRVTFIWLVALKLLLIYRFPSLFPCNLQKKLVYSSYGFSLGFADYVPMVSFNIFLCPKIPFKIYI